MDFKNSGEEMDFFNAAAIKVGFDYISIEGFAYYPRSPLIKATRGDKFVSVPYVGTKKAAYDIICALTSEYFHLTGERLNYSISDLPSH